MLRLAAALLFLLAGFAAPARAEDDLCPAKYMRLSPKKLEALTLEDSDRDLFEAQMKIASPKQADTWNRALLRALDNLAAPEATPGRKPGLTPSERRQLFQTVNEHPVANGDMVDHYAPEGGTGFCFGRAITAHIEALRTGLDKESIKKLWIIGYMKGDTTEWGHHVTTIVRGKDKHWYTIDPNYDEPLRLSTWLKNIKDDFTNEGDLQLFATNPSRFGPEGGVNAGPILPSTVEDPFYHDYFVDLMTEFRRDSQRMLEQKRIERGYCPITSAPGKKKKRAPRKRRKKTSVEACLEEAL